MSRSSGGLLSIGKLTLDDVVVEGIGVDRQQASGCALSSAGSTPRTPKPFCPWQTGPIVGQCNEGGRRMVEIGFRRADPGDRPRRTESAGMSAGVLLLDSAEPSDVRAAAASGVVAGVTTNPTLLRTEERQLAIPAVDPPGQAFAAVQRGASWALMRGGLTDSALQEFESAVPS